MSRLVSTRSEAIEVGAPNIRPETLKRGKSKDFASSKATKNLHMALHNVEDDDADSSDDEKAAVLFGEGPLRKDVSNRPIVRVAPRTCKVFVRISSVRGIPEAEAGKNSNGVVLRCSLLNDSRDLGIFKAKKAGQPATRFFLGDGNMKEAEDSDVVCFEVEEPIVNAIVKIDVYSNKEGAKNVKIGRFCIDCSGMPKTVCKDSRSSFFKINQRTGVPLSLGNGKFKLLRSPKKAKVKASVNVDANGEFTFAGKSKLKPLSTLSGFTATESADRSGTTVTRTTGNVAARSDGASMSNTSFTNGRSIEPNDVEYLGEVKVATRIVRSIDPLATPIVGSTRPDFENETRSVGIGSRDCDSTRPFMGLVTKRLGEISRRLETRIRRRCSGRHETDSHRSIRSSESGRTHRRVHDIPILAPVVWERYRRDRSVALGGRQ